MSYKKTNNKKHSKVNKKRKLKLSKRQKVLQKIITNLLKKIPKKKRRPAKFNDDFYVKRIISVLYSGSTWEESVRDLDCDESTVRKKFNKYVHDGIIEAAYIIIKNDYCHKKQFKEFYMDTFVVKNSNAHKYVDYYYKMKSKKQMKIAIISNNDNVIMSYDICESPKIHDSKTIDPLIEKLDSKTIKSKILIAADKGFIRKKKKYRKNGKHCELVVPKKKIKNNIRKNQKF